ncbi:cis-prenyltransferase [Plasmodium brasilianum]|uniref:Cis-prenyltransferase n=1 Tax=Plasmodium brasilianum TaxID=5824 RepID=A0ACB9YDQ5_PLABR|nr:cis-prenyltransferase [Plasmodium brasilianum]
MDGNRRFAKDKGMHTSLGHYMGSKTLIQIIEICVRLNIKILSVFSLSLLNYNRSPEEIHFLFYLNLLILINEEFFFNFVKDHKIRIKVIGNLSYVNEHYRKIIHDIEQKTKEFDNLTLNIFFSYTSRNEMSLCKFNPNLYYDTYKNLLQERKICYSTIALRNTIKRDIGEYVQSSAINETIHSKKIHEMKCYCGQRSFLDEEQLKIVKYHKKLLTSDLPPPNILIRTSGEQRLSDFMLYQVGRKAEKNKKLLH